MKKPKVTYLHDYRPPDYIVQSIDLHFELYEEHAIVNSLLKVSLNREHNISSPPLVLDGSNQQLRGISLNGRPLSGSEYDIKKHYITIFKVPEQFTLEISTNIYPQNNTSLEGLYKSGNMFCTQCEAEGFRKITYFPDRPDVMAKYNCTISADKDKYPVLLSNGNIIDKGESSNNRHWVKWEDPHKKPSYLFALVAGDLLSLEDKFTCKSGRNVSLKIYTEHFNAGKCGHAMEALKKAMKWDEEVYDREYDLDVYMIVAVNDFNMGAMENKGLNIFNSKYILAKPETATDTDFRNIEAVIAHEYFHNWTGNRITLKNWFQLSLKEGLTVFRDQEFSAHISSGAVKRIADVRKLRLQQFPEDAGPMAHPVRPESYIQMNNFYTHTVYEKGAEVIRMIQTILGQQGFKKGMDLYFERHDGQAVTTDDFVDAMEDANGTDLTQFRLWYSRAGTPVIQVNRSYDKERGIFSLKFTQKTQKMTGRNDNAPLHIPISTGLLNRDGLDIPLFLTDKENGGDKTTILNLKENEQTFHFKNVPEMPVPSILRGFSAPVKLSADYSYDELLFLMANDSDDFNRWEAGQKIFSGMLVKLMNDFLEKRELKVDDSIIEAIRKSLLDKSTDKGLISHTLTLPSEIEMEDMVDCIDVEAIHFARDFAERFIATKLEALLQSIYEENRECSSYDISHHSMSRRSLKNLALHYLGKLESEDMPKMIIDQFENAGNMTDEVAALTILSDIACIEREKALKEFYEKWCSDTVVLDKWFAIQAGSQLPDTLEQVLSLMHHKDFSIRNPNKVFSLIGGFCNRSRCNFHHISGKGYRFLTEQVLILDKLNPQIAARLVSTFNRWRKYDSLRQGVMKEQMERIVNEKNLSDNVYEIVSKALK